MEKEVKWIIVIFTWVDNITLKNDMYTLDKCYTRFYQPSYRVIKNNALIVDF